MSEDDKKDFKDRRKHKRFKVKSGTCMFNEKSAEIIDISMGGMAFSYVDDGEWTDETFDRGMLFGEKDLRIEEVPLKIISDCAINSGLSITSRRGVKFGKLTDKQLAQLEYYIWANTDANEEEIVIVNEESS
jgi:hypothetical protein